VKSQGAIEFDRVGKTGVEWATLLGVTSAAVSRWRSGTAKPAQHLRLEIQKHGGPDPQLWDQIPGTKAPKKRRKVKVVKATPAAVSAEADLWLAQLADLRVRIPLAALDVEKETRLLASASKTFQVLGKAAGVGINVTSRAILDSPNWRLLEIKILDALAPWPDALRAVADALDDTRSKP
jgi:hypothetical protein